jgi:hypothetical protein
MHDNDGLVQIITGPNNGGKVKTSFELLSH